MHKPAILALADGSVFYGLSLGCDGDTVGEVVFNTAMTGYQEILTDPSYAQQLVTLTYPHIGNTGMNLEDEESQRPWASGLIIRNPSLISSSWRARHSLEDYLHLHRIVSIYDIDTRRLTRLLRDKGAQNGCIMAGKIDEALALEKARAYPGLEGMDLAKVVTTQNNASWQEGTWGFDKGHKHYSADHFKLHVVAYDFGVKRNILRLLVDRGCKVTVVPAKTPAKDVLALKPDGVFLSNGPGDPAPCDYAIENINILLAADMPLFGICLGHQLLALACGAKTTKMKFGHHGANHPIQDVASKTVFISSQNHGFVVDEASLPKNLCVTHRSLFDGTVQGFTHSEKSAMSFQGHPEASPGPHDIGPVFDNFIKMMTQETESQALSAEVELTCQNAQT